MLLPSLSMGVPAQRIEPDPELELSKCFLMGHKMNTWTARCLSNHLGAGLHPSSNPARLRGIVLRNSRTDRFSGIAQGSFGSSWLRGHLVSSIAWTDTTCVLPLYNCLSDSVVESVNTAVLISCILFMKVMNCYQSWSLAYTPGHSGCWMQNGYWWSLHKQCV